MNLVLKSLGITAAFFGGAALVILAGYLIITYLGLAVLMGLFLFAGVFILVYGQVKWDAEEAERDARLAKQLKSHSAARRKTWEDQ
jgi:hypothetical protein